jgi:dipeptidyl aminopeptidase/acylaminoacyl peptidase
MSDGLRVHGRLYVPRTDKKLPVVIFNHDGIDGITKSHHLSSIRMANYGYVVFSPSYRGEDGSEGQIEIAKGEVNDVLNSIKLMSTVKEADTERIAFAGASHGALISLLAASRTDRVNAIVSAYGVADIYKWYDYMKANNKLGNDKITRQTYGDGPQDRPQSFAIRNAVSFVDRIKAPVLILQGDQDDIVPTEQAIFLKNALDKHNVPNILKIYPDCLHGFLVYAPYYNVKPAEKQQTEEAWKVMMDFLDKHLKQ